MNEYVLTEKTNLTAIADTIRAKTNSTSSMTIGDMIDGINGLGGGNITLGQSCTVYFPRNGVQVTAYYLDEFGSFHKVVNISNQTIYVLKNSILMIDNSHFESSTFIAPSNMMLSKYALIVKDNIVLEYADNAPD